jgi:hypothetical protein
MEIAGKILKKYAVPNIAADREEYRRIFEDMRQFGGSFIPAPTWLLCKHPRDIETNDLHQIIDTAGSDEIFQNEFSDLEQRMEGWIGTPQSIVDASVSHLVSEYASFLGGRDPLGLWRANVDNSAVAKTLIVADLGSIMDLNFLYAYAFDPTRQTTTILEVGGGYGRLAEAAFNVFGKSIRYVLVDSVPVSLYYSKKYLERACPDIRVGSYYSGDPFDMNEFHCYIVPSWYFSKLNKEQYDICINIQSFQEMNQVHVDSYIDLFDQVSVEGATVYISNLHDYIFIGNWNYPNHWQKLFCANTPRSWNSDGPSEVFVKRTGDYSSQNAMLDDIHHYLRSKQDRASGPAVQGATLGDQVELLAGKRVRSVLRSGKSHLKPVFERLVALRRKEQR